MGKQLFIFCEKLAMTEEFQEEVKLENEKKKLEGNSKGGKVGKEVSVQLDADLNEKQNPKSILTPIRVQNIKWKNNSNGLQLEANEKQI